MPIMLINHEKANIIRLYVMNFPHNIKTPAVAITDNGPNISGLIPA